VSGAYEGPRRTKLPFPVNILLNTKVAYISFIIIMIASMGAVGFAGSSGSSPDAPPAESNTSPEPTGINADSFPEGPAPVIDATKPRCGDFSNKGDIQVDLVTDAPGAINNFLSGGNGFCNGTAIFYVIRLFARAVIKVCARGGHALPGTSGTATLPIEGALGHGEWVVVARQRVMVRTSGSQFRILYKADPRLDGTETVFGGSRTPRVRKFWLHSIPRTLLDRRFGSCRRPGFHRALVIEKIVVKPA
jgi:cyclophilin family peptidyl-prolyl cis-trans isomerase